MSHEVLTHAQCQRNAEMGRSLGVVVQQPAKDGHRQRPAYLSKGVSGIPVERKNQMVLTSCTKKWAMTEMKLYPTIERTLALDFSNS